MRIFLTGGAGYIGGVVAKQLLAAGHDVTVFDNLSRGHRAAVPEDATFIQGDLLNREDLQSALTEDFDAVLHFAAFALVGESVQHPEMYYENNTIGSFNLLSAMQSVGVKRLVFSSTCATYGQPERIPIDELTPTEPTNPYGASKLFVDRMISDQAAAHDLAAVSLRYFNVAGASGKQGEDHDPETHIVPNVLRVALGQSSHVDIYGDDYPTPDGTAIRDYIHIEDLAAAHLLAVTKPQPGEHLIYNLGSGSGFSVLEVIEAARKVTGHAIPVRFAERRLGDPAKLVAASDLIRRELLWSPAKPELEQMIADAWEWHQRYPQGYPKSF